MNMTQTYMETNVLSAPRQYHTAHLKPLLILPTKAVNAHR